MHVSVLTVCLVASSVNVFDTPPMTDFSLLHFTVSRSSIPVTAPLLSIDNGITGTVGKIDFLYK